MDRYARDGSSLLNAVTGAAAGLLVGLLVGGAYYGVALRQELAGRRRLLAQVGGIKFAVAVDWRKERLADFRQFAEDPVLLLDYRSVSAPESRRRLQERFRHLRRRQGMKSAFVYLGDRLVFVSPADAPAGRDASEFDLEQAIPGGRLVFRFGDDLELFRTLAFWPAQERGFSTQVVHGEPAAGPDEAVFPVPGLGWTLVSRFDPAFASSAALKRAVLIGVAAGGFVAAALLLLLDAHRRRLLAGVREADAGRALLAQAVEQASESVVITDAHAVIQYVNPAFSRVTGYSREEVVGRKPNVLKSGKHDKAFYEELWATLARGETWQGRLINRRKDGALYDEEASIGPVRGPDGKVTHYIAVKRDASKERQLEEQMRHAQKMEAVGRLAGGVAHDFNNILTSIIGYSEMVASGLPPGAQQAEDIAEVLKAARLAAALTSRLLTFSRRQIIEPATIEINEPVRLLEKMLRRTLGERVELRLDLHAEPLWVRLDPAQAEQILLNLAINARDAMPEGGLLRITTAPVELSVPMRHALITVPAGRYARLSVVDDGTGMAPETLERVFEPFFTTKEKGRGTGLGLATVFGIVRQNGGSIAVDSAQGWGSVFTIYLPLVPAPEAEAARDAAPAEARRAGTILLVEDQDEVRLVAERSLRSAGYSVLPCRDGSEALAVVAAHRGGLDLLLADVIMPGIGGNELSERLRVLRPETPILFMSGYTDETVAESGILRPGVDLIAKPFSPSNLLARVASAIARGRSGLEAAAKS